MTFAQAKPQPISASNTPQQHHAKAAEHLEIAVKSHKEAAKLIGDKDHKGAEVQAKIAHEHTAQAKEHMLEATKKPLIDVK